MIEGMRMDLTFTRYSTFEELKLYCYRVAGTVGLMSERVMGVDTGYTSAMEYRLLIRLAQQLLLVLLISSPISLEMLVKIVIVVVFIFLWRISTLLVIQKSNCLMVLLMMPGKH